VAGVATGRFVDIGGGDGLSGSNCANLAFNLGFHGLFIDGDGDRVRRGQDVYGSHPDTSLYPPRFICNHVTRENVSTLIGDGGLSGEIDVLSIDIDGNDYWVWEALEGVTPRIVVVETHPEFGLNSVVVPYRADFRWERGMNPDYLGASPAAVAKLARKLGYRLVAGNRYGFNAIFLRNDLAPDIAEIPVENLFHHPRAQERVAIFDRIADLPWVRV
jgi:hypothetical protein